MAQIHTAFLLAAGKGTRMRPLTDVTPKPLIKVAGKALLDYQLDAAVRAGVQRAVVNVHYLADQIEVHLQSRDDIEIAISDEREQLLETGGAIVKALPLLGDDPILVMNTDAFWNEAEIDAVSALIDGYDPERMDDYLLLADREACLGFDGAGDFDLHDDGHLTRRSAETAKWAYAGTRITNPKFYADRPLEPFSANVVWNEALPKGRIHGRPLGTFWMHVGDPAARDAAERHLTGVQSSKRAC